MNHLNLINTIKYKKYKTCFFLSYILYVNLIYGINLEKENWKNKFHYS